MKRSLSVSLCLCLLLPAGMAAQATGGDRAPGGTFVNSAWLAGHLSDPNLVLLYVGTDSAYKVEHIPGSQFARSRDFAAPFDTAAMAMMHDPARRALPHALTLELPATARLDSALAAIGVTAKSTVVVTYEDWFTPSARILLTLEYAGLKGHVFLLDRGVSVWKSEGRPVTTAVPAARRGDYRSTAHPDVVVDAAFVAAHLHSKGVVIVDARDPEFYNGTTQSEMNPRGGHIAGAKSIPYVVLADSTNHMYSDAELRKIFAAAGVMPGDTVVSYCHIGQQGSLVYAVARELGFAARLYDGSFEDWSIRSELPVEGGK